MEIVKKTASTIKNNWIGALAGAGLGFLAAKKLIKTEKTWLKIVISIAGAAIGATVQSKIGAAKGAPTATTVKK